MKQACIAMNLKSKKNLIKRNKIREFICQTKESIYKAKDSIYKTKDSICKAKESIYQARDSIYKTKDSIYKTKDSSIRETRLHGYESEVDKEPDKEQ